MKCDITGMETKPKIGENGKELLPRGWRRWNKQTYSAAAWKQHFVCRAIAIPVKGPIEGTWAELRAALAIGWGQARTVANVAASTLFAAEAPRGNETKMPPAPKVDLYNAARAAVPDMPTKSLNAVTQSAARKYSAHRYNVVWNGSESLPSHRYPQPYPIVAVGWGASLGEHGEPIIAFRLGQKRWKLELRRAGEFARQYKDFCELVNGNALRVEMAICRKRVGGDGGRNGVTKNGSRGGQRVMFQVMAKLVGYFPRKTRKDRNGVLAVATGADCLLFGIRGDNHDRIWWFNADQARRWESEHSKFVQRMSEDRKAEIRCPSWKSRQMNSILSKRTTKFDSRMNTLIDQASAMLAKFAARRGMKTVCYDDSCRTFIPNFRYFQLKESIKRKLENEGIDFELSSDDSDNAPLPGAEPGACDASV